MSVDPGETWRLLARLAEDIPHVDDVELEQWLMAMKVFPSWQRSWIIKHMYRLRKWNRLSEADTERVMRKMKEYKPRYPDNITPIEEMFKYR
jgi:hypothetical protein